jgi:methyl-accepting chemotaxis protein
VLRKFAQLPTAAWRRAVVVAAVVGTLLTLINQWDALGAGRVDLVKAMLTYLVPFGVSIYSAAATRP